MLKSTYRAASTEVSLPEGWTEHKAPTGHVYYYNAETKQSTYTRPVVEPDEPLQIDYNATQPDPVIRASLQVLEDFHKNNDEEAHFTGGRTYQDRSRRRDQGDRPKSKAPIPNCTPWILVKTKMRRRFVHNTETKQSLWKFPGDVMMAVIEMDRLEWEKEKAEQEETKHENEKPKESLENVAHPDRRPSPEPYDSDSYEEVEVTDEEDGEDDGHELSTKRPRLSPRQPNTPEGPVEFNEDDIAWQLAQMEADEGGNDFDEEAEDGLPITDEDSLALFRSLLDDFGVNPYSTFERVIEDPAIVDDPRYTSLPNTSRRRQGFLEWAHDRVAELQAKRKLEAATTADPQDPKIAYLRFLHTHATPKLYWPEFKRKFKKESELKDYNLSDKDREKLYREYISKLKLSESDRRKDLVTLLKGFRKELNRQSTLEDLPQSLLKDVRFILLPATKRDELVMAHIATLPDA